ncbi:hypothetical protein CCR75_004606 [Bremia lactucae]|uniref:RRM domain-containing protein n=1 Tax=Bremia lactucae TaxID=4779 RepID=A0A976IM54_BRELC|nr:hypothetical protein CCR75_004606 [Bremia lactucae]
MYSEQERIERARAKNLAYIQSLDDREASQAASGCSLKHPAHGSSKGNNSVYITGLTTYMACRQLEGVCHRLGKVRRIKFYEDEKGGLKGDAVVTFSSRVTMLKAVERLIRVSYRATQLHHFEVKPGVIITASEAQFSTKTSVKEEENTANSNAVGINAKSNQRTLESVATPLTILPAMDASPLDLPSRSIILDHVWDPLEDSEVAFFDDLEEDMRTECSKHGTVEHVHIVANGSVIVRFAELKAAIACLKVLNGRWFAGRQLEARFDQATAENSSDAETKVEAFLASLGE